MAGKSRAGGSSFGWVRGGRAAWIAADGDNVGVIVYIVLTVLIFGLLGLTLKWVERL